AGLGAYGAYEFTHGLEGEVTYLVLAAPLIAVSAALIPPIAKLTWRRGHFLKAVLWWIGLGPAAARVFFSAAGRGHVAKGGAEAERMVQITHGEDGHGGQSSPGTDAVTPNSA